VNMENAKAVPFNGRSGFKGNTGYLCRCELFRMLLQATLAISCVAFSYYGMFLLWTSFC
jgi:hypothetical protein